jgi:hypothetical protein
MTTIMVSRASPISYQQAQTYITQGHRRSASLDGIAGDFSGMHHATTETLAQKPSSTLPVRKDIAADTGFSITTPRRASRKQNELNDNVQSRLIFDQSVVSRQIALTSPSTEGGQQPFVVEAMVPYSQQLVNSRLGNGAVKQQE